MAQKFWATSKVRNESEIFCFALDMQKARWPWLLVSLAELSKNVREQLFFVSLVGY